jgi:hypothetical protein
MALPEANNSLEKRVYHYKKPSMEFYCPLCRSRRAFLYRPGLSMKHYVQMLITTVVISLATFSMTSWRCFIYFFILWAAFEFFNRVLLCREVPCPHCGFNASWYKRDVKVARQLVKKFWEGKNISTGTASASKTTEQNKKEKDVKREETIRSPSPPTSVAQ